MPWVQNTGENLVKNNQRSLGNLIPIDKFSGKVKSHSNNTLPPISPNKRCKNVE